MFLSILFTVFTFNTLNNKSQIDDCIDKIVTQCPGNIKMFFVYFSDHGRRFPGRGDAIKTSDGNLLFTNDIKSKFSKSHLNNNL